MDTDISAAKLEERAIFFGNECNRLRTELILENSPTKRFQIEQDLKEAIEQKDLAEKLLAFTSRNLSQSKKEGMLKHIISDDQTKTSNTEHQNINGMKTLDVFVSHSSSDETVAELGLKGSEPFTGG